MLYKHNPVEFRRLYRKDSATAVTPLVPSLNPADYAYSHPSLSGGAESNVKEALDALLSLTVEPPFEGNSWQKFTAAGEFVVPDGVTKVLALAISQGGRGTCSGSAGNYTSVGGLGGVLVSAFLQTSPGKRYTVTTGISYAAQTDINTSILDEEGTKVLCPTPYATYYYFNAVQNYDSYIPEGVVRVDRAANGLAATSRTGGRGGGGFAVPDGDDESERKAWLKVALEGFNPSNPSATTWSGTLCYPDTSKSSVTWDTVSYGGKGAAYGGGGGGAGLSATASQYRGTGGPGFVAFFW